MQGSCWGESMAVIVKTSEPLRPQLDALPPEAHLWIYCGFDACVPQEILPEIKSLFSTESQLVYDFERTMQGPALSMMLTGVPVDQAQVGLQIAELEKLRDDLTAYTRSMFVTFCGSDVNVNSPDQMADFFYFSDAGLQMKPRYARRKTGSSITTNRDALESIANEYYYSKPLIAAILDVKDLTKQLEFLKRGVDSDHRIRCTFSVSATETGRWSSSKNPWGRGGNFQNQNEKIRKIYQPDEGRIFLSPDLKQAESYAVGYLSGDEKYIAALESSDLHTTVAKMVWPDLAWPNDSGRGDRAVADAAFYRHFSYRDMSKRGGHGSNYLGSAQEMARNLKLPTDVMERFQYTYFHTFTKIPQWHREVQIRLQSDGFLVSPLGRKRTFFGRLSDNSTLKEAIASIPQGLISDILKTGLYKIWKKYEAPWGQDPRRPVALYADLHDGALMGVRVELLDEIAEDILKLLTIPVRMPFGVMTIPVELTVGWKWQKKKPKETRPKHEYLHEWRRGILSDIGPRPDNSLALLDLDAKLF